MKPLMCPNRRRNPAFGSMSAKSARVRGDWISGTCSVEPGAATGGVVDTTLGLFCGPEFTCAIVVPDMKIAIQAIGIPRFHVARLMQTDMRQREGKFHIFLGLSSCRTTVQGVFGRVLAPP